eukprot:gene16843-biopygen4775
MRTLTPKLLFTMGGCIILTSTTAVHCAFLSSFKEPGPGWGGPGTGGRGPAGAGEYPGYQETGLGETGKSTWVREAWGTAVSNKLQEHGVGCIGIWQEVGRDMGDLLSHSSGPVPPFRSRTGEEGCDYPSFLWEPERDSQSKQTATTPTEEEG